jgi:hypothetical protein
MQHISVVVHSTFHLFNKCKGYLNHHWLEIRMFYSFLLQEKKKELQLNFEEEERRIRMKSVGNIR